MLTPEGASPPSPEERRPSAGARVLPSHASPSLEEKVANMRRTPQPNLTQSKLTSMLHPQGKQTEAGGATTYARRMITLDEVEDEMDTATTPDPAPPATGGSAFLTVDLFLKAMKENRDDIISSFNASIGTLSRRIEDNSALISANAAAIKQQSDTAAGHKSDLDKLADRVGRVERDPGAPRGGPIAEKRAVLSRDFMLARRSIRLWPIRGEGEDAMWEEVGDFLHDTLAIRTDDVGQNDIELVSRVQGSGIVAENGEALVTFFDKKKRDLVLTHSPSLASKVDSDNRPTAGIRLEIPPELNDTFRLLTRFGARLRARHGTGTKKHIKFDDFNASLFVNVKLPGDTGCE